MNAEIHHLEPVTRSGQHATPRLRTLVVCDIADSTALVERMGDQNAANIIRKHDRLARALVEKHDGREIDKTDGFLLLFERPIQAVAFALDYQRGLKHLSAAEGMVLRARVGIHMGDVVIWENAPEDVSRGAKPIEVEGLVKPVAARLAQLALPQQILVSFAATSIARRAQRELGADTAGRVHWKEHGRYRFKGLPEPMDVAEVGEEEIAPLRAPRSGRTAKKILPWYRRPFTLAAEAAMLAIGIGFGTWFLLQSPPTLAFAKRDWVVVGDLHNLTGDPRFNQSLETALHISLEQSQYVNVLPELSVQQTLQRMERNPDKTKVTRAIGSEIAMRDGARALILPTLAEVGGRVRVTAEVVDPNTQTTVYSVSADGVGAQSVLPSLDSVSKQLRGKLGEALAMVTKESQPLDKVATSNLDALRAYSLGTNAYNVGNLKDAEALYRQAIALDPKFALAHIGLAKVFNGIDQDAAAVREIQIAASSPGRLSARDGLYAQAWLATFESPRAALEKWKLLSSLYPDFFPAANAHAYFLWQYANRFQEATTALDMSTSAHNPHRGSSEYLMGALDVEADRYADALRYFAAAKADGVAFQNAYWASAYAAQRQFAKAARTLAQGKQSGTLSFDIGTQATRIALAVDQGQWNDVAKTLAEAKQQAQAVGPRDVRLFNGMDLSLRSLEGSAGKDQHAALTSYLKEAQSALGNNPSVDRDAIEFHVLLAGYLAAHANDAALAHDALNSDIADARSGNFPVLSNMLAIADAELARASGHPEQAVKLLEPLLDGNELCITHVALMDAYASEANPGAALREARWLASHRGRAYLEYNASQTLTPFNVMQSDLAILHAAEFSLAMHKNSDARAFMADFHKAWPEAMNQPWLSPRLHKLQTQL